MIQSAGPDLHELFSLFAPADDVPTFEIVSWDAVPEPYHGLLVHDHHMTVTVEQFYGGRVGVRILDRQQTAEWYARKILLYLERDNRVVQFGIMRVHYEHLSDKVRQEIQAGDTPLGRVLIENDVHRRVQPTAFLRIQPRPGMVKYLEMERAEEMFGRLAYLHCNNKPAVEVLEIVTPAR
jgi:chorismate-pyruvate lyase